MHSILTCILSVSLIVTVLSRGGLSSPPAGLGPLVRNGSLRLGLAAPTHLISHVGQASYWEVR